VFTRAGQTWSQQAYVKASNTDAKDQFGYSVALSADGNTLAVGADSEASAATGINGDQADNTTDQAGAGYVYRRSGSTWSQQAYVKASRTTSGGFGTSIALSGDASTLAVGAAYESSAATGVNGNQDDSSAPFSGAVYLFTFNGAAWNQQAYVKASNTGISTVPGMGYQFGGTVVLSGDGDVLAVGSQGEPSATTGINGNQSDTSAPFAGAAYVFTRTGTTWSQEAYVKASDTHESAAFGDAMGLSPDATTLVVGARGPNAAYAFHRGGTTWSQHAYVKSSNTDAQDEFGNSVGVASDGTLAVGAWLESSAATGINGNQADNSASEAGAAYVFQ
jgi:hypothetical protein